jgi:hypothetical protein
MFFNENHLIKVSNLIIIFYIFASSIKTIYNKKKINPMPSNNINYKKIKRNLMKRDMDLDSRFSEKVVTPKNKKDDKHKSWKFGLDQDE